MFQTSACGELIGMTDACTCACTCVSLFFLLCGAVSCRVSRVVVGWVVFVFVSWSLVVIEKIERRRKSKREMARRSLNK